MLLVLDFKRVISKYSEVRTYGISPTGDFQVGETCEISVFKQREVAHPVASASTVTDEASYGRDREGAHPPDEIGMFQ